MKQSWMLVAATIFSSPLLAQSDSSQTLDPVVVTANKFEQKQSTTGKVITVISKRQIEQSAGKSLPQLLNEQAGLTIAGGLNSLGTPLGVFTRGTSSGRTLILIDGVPVCDPSQLNNEFDLNLLPLDNIERIEICKGAQSTLYGSDAIGGVINILTVNKDVKKPFNAKATLLGGNYGTLKGNAQVYGRSKKLNYQAAYAKTYTEGYSSAYDKTGNGHFDRDGFNGDALNASFQYELAPGFHLRGFTRYSWYQAEIDNGIFQDATDFTSDNKNLLAGANFQYKNEVISVTGNYQYNDASRLLFNDSLDIPGSLGRDDYFGKTQFAELYTNIRLSDQLSLLQGADFRHHTLHQKNLVVWPASLSGPAGSAFTQVDSVASQASLYASVIYASPDGQLNVELGGRLNVHSRFGSNYTYTFNPSYTIDSNYRLFGSIATGFKAPSLYQLYDPSYGDFKLQPERSFNVEVGIQQTHEKISNRVVLFYRTIRNGLDFSNTEFKYFNFNRQKAQGLEWETSVQATEKMRITGNFTVLKITETTQSRKTFNDTTYRYSLRKPPFGINLTAGYQITKPLYISVSGKYAAKRRDTGGYKMDDLDLSSYFLLGAHAELQASTWFTFFANAQNITNKRFFDINGYNSIPFMVSGGVAWKL